MPSSLKSFPIVGLPVHLSTDYAGWLIQSLKEHQGIHVVTLNAEMAMMTKQNSILAKIIKSSQLVIPDGAGITLSLKLNGIDQKRCPGIQLAEVLIQILSNEKDRHPIAFYGGKPGVAKKSAEKWLKKLPKADILTNHGYLSSKEEEDWKNILFTRQPKLILVGLGVPSQEQWIYKNRDLCPESIWMGIGGSFDIWSENKSRAPLWLQNNNLEWLYRLYQEPWRWKRMLTIPKFFLEIFLNQ
ncbi:WecB/TagA/CpsF family glycosyltransferase [Candidatus Atelocyanobacterium thalassae]|uniref:N-acetylglucosaminyldiphosphoundecaprenol N-acetyl-beta-D-mannosaminyltransferase n=1 Tax=cyanobacterium endosymbiont of Braarudosphaera bigelowii TaxID=1285375 RepID=A0ABN6K0F2_9CHRO|nr:WecB/TagA/CpsF family glycosyltransferase [Candidatus Atelocyanobacterium thalassa]BDA40230.1 N-acetylglucosaminyldiphosphoundecaprenol N-acetyl-beta-D-mannosaminyltransferase [cyanobacterium endosymbiont of Braarudosphaera bigelowii]